ncbi:hypothetical protein FA95DRAFT_742980 [Auriscalpium vulgare]|uniref:Uncharacterized protein n=1 Tax=Auriscalpium vulgare TaxID=40419 RepID=A0ACB8SAD6_9AGAM|nr:hypothetical protein FA95DRAFT_742980 [Auriscalpium vulgare]
MCAMCARSAKEAAGKATSAPVDGQVDETRMNAPENKAALGVAVDRTLQTIGANIMRQFIEDSDTRRSSAVLRPELMNDDTRLVGNTGQLHTKKSSCNFIMRTRFILVPADLDLIHGNGC